MLIQLLVSLVVIALLVWAVRTLVPAFGIPDPISTVIHVILVVVVVFWLLSILGIVSSPFGRPLLSP